MPRSSPRLGPHDELNSLATRAQTDVAALNELLGRTTALRRQLARIEATGRPLDPMVSPDDIAQEVAIEVVASIHTFDPQRGPFVAWLTAITRHLVYRRSRRRPTIAFQQHQRAAQIPTVALRQTLSSKGLSPEERGILAMVAVGCTGQDIARMLGIKPAAATKRIQRARARLAPNLP